MPCDVRVEAHSEYRAPPKGEDLDRSVVFIHSINVLSKRYLLIEVVSLAVGKFFFQHEDLNKIFELVVTVKELRL